MERTIDRRRFLAAGGGSRSETPDEHCISSAVVTVQPARQREVAERLAAMPGVEVRGEGDHRIVLVLEGPGSGAVGGLLVAISVMDGVIAANMVFEHVEPNHVAGA